jgi:uncharacterized coiled-coil protein SlyX
MSANTNINASEALTREQIKRIIDPFTRQMEEFNINLVNNLNNLQFKEYFDFAKNSCFNDINLDFMEELMQIARSKYLYVVDHTELQRFGVLTSIKTSNNILRCLNSYFMKPDRDYIVHKSSSKRKQGGGLAKNEYFLTQAAFKKLLMRAENCEQYADYYVLLELVISYYNEYRLMYAERLIQDRDNIIVQLNSTVSEQGRRIEELLALGHRTNNSVEVLKTQNIELTQKVDEVKTHNEELLEEVSDVKGELTTVNKKLTDTTNEFTTKLEVIQEAVDVIVEQRTIPPENPILLQEFALIQMTDTTTHEVYRIIRGQQKTVNKSIKGLPKDATTVLHRQFEPNPIDSYIRLKDEIDNFNAQILKNISDLRIAPKERTRRKREYRNAPAGLHRLLPALRRNVKNRQKDPKK